MNKLYSKFLAIILFAFAIGGCKVDAPVYPADTIYTLPAGGNGGGGNTVSGRTITYTIDGKTITIKNNVVFQVYPADQSFPNGSIQIGGGTDVSNLFSLAAPIKGTGTFDISAIIVSTELFGDTGTVTITQYNVNGNSGTIAGTFTGEVGDLSGGTTKTVTGSFSIKM
jgi:hypothetical protein